MPNNMVILWAVGEIIRQADENRDRADELKRTDPYAPILMDMELEVLTLLEAGIALRKEYDSPRSEQ